jgi:uncharacterized protein YxeA
LDKWDNREYNKSQNTFGSKKTIIMLIGIMIIMWGILGFLSYYKTPIDCDNINNFVDSFDFYNMDDELKQKYTSLQYECNKHNIIVK